MTSPDPSTNSNNLSSVSCPTTTNCFAVGAYATTPGADTLVEQWNGTSWSMITTPNPSADTNKLAGVSCPSTTNCFAVGSYRTNGSQYALIERYA
jgi:hypothetical protein